MSWESTQSVSALPNAAVAGPETRSTCQACELHHDAVRCAIRRIRSTVSSGTGSGRNARQL